VFAPDCAASVVVRKASGKISKTAAVQYVSLYSQTEFHEPTDVKAVCQSLLYSESDAILHPAECFYRDSHRAAAELIPCSGGTCGAVRWHY